MSKTHSGLISVQAFGRAMQTNVTQINNLRGQNKLQDTDYNQNLQTHCIIGKQH